MKSPTPFKPLHVSVVIPAYNRAGKVERAIGSICEPDIEVEVIVVDDASTDDTRQRLEHRQDIRYLRHAHNQGAAAARNTGIIAAQSPYVAFLDSDDLREPRSLQQQLQRLQEQPTAALAHGPWYFLGSSPAAEHSENAAALAEGDVYDLLLRNNIIKTTTVVARTEVLRELKGFDTRYHSAEEWDLWLRLCARHTICVVGSPVAAIEAADDDTHLSGDPVKIERNAVAAVRNHLWSDESRIKDTRQRDKIYAAFRRGRIDRILWRVSARGAHMPRGRRLDLVRRGLGYCFALDTAYMLLPANLKTIAKLLFNADT